MNHEASSQEALCCPNKEHRPVRQLISHDAENQQLAQKIGSLLKKSLGMPPDRACLNFTGVPAANRGWNGDTFG